MIRGIAAAAAFATLAVTGGAMAQQEIRDCEGCPQMIAVPAGSLARSDRNGGDNFTVTVKAFAIARFEVTVAEFRRFVDAAGYAPAAGCQLFSTVGGRDDPAAGWLAPGYTVTDTRPATCLSVEDAEAYAAWLSAETGATYRLPSEAEWEYAARAGRPNSSQWYATGFLRAGDANCATCFGGEVMGREDQLSPFDVTTAENPFGIAGMLGNVAEWTADCLGETFADAPADGAPRTDGDCGMRAARGGAFHNEWQQLAGFRVPHGAATHRNDVGFRLVREL
ncbi:MAG: SUMF1/EgtB/PvdO family nonheme iron enzyme [Proteobacteria bacterium]|nr:SUMF1/EgtB/PvdO family nonheme iron enzyme [Pseudomonadota bacterium]